MENIEEKETINNYKDNYIKKLENENKLLIELIQNVMKKLLLIIILIPLLFCILFGFIAYQYFHDNFYNTNITGDSNTAVLSNDFKDGDLDIN